MCRRVWLAEEVDGEEQREELAQSDEQRDGERRALSDQLEQPADEHEVGHHREQSVCPQARHRHVHQWNQREISRVRVGHEARE